MDADVGIIGGGPVGIALAVELGQRGLDVRVLERHHEVGRVPKGQSLMQRSLEHFYFWGCLDELRAARLLPPGYPIGGITAYGNLASEYWYIPHALDDIAPYYFQRNERLPQYRTEEVLRARAAELDNVHIDFDTTATSFTEHDDGVRVAVRNSHGVDELRASFIVGCDGSHSMVRERLGITRTTRDFHQRMVLAVFASRGLHDGLTRFPERTTYRVINPKLRGVWQFFGRVKLGETWFFHGPVDDDLSASDTGALHAILEEAAGFSFECEFEHIGFWDLRVDCADTYQSGRTFIAGDACHTHPPYGGLGLNTGLDDVANLGWKLAASLDGWGGAGLLDTYTTERRPVFAQTGTDLIGKWIDDEAAFLSEYDPVVDEHAFAHAWSSRTSGEFAPPWYEPHYDGSPLVVGAATDDIGIHGTHTFVAQAGHHLAPAVLSDGRNVYEALGHDFALLAFGAPAGAAAFRDAASSLGVPLRVVEDSAAGERARYGAPLILVRPDHFVAWAGDGDAATDVLRAATGHDVRMSR